MNPIGDKLHSTLRQIRDFEARYDREAGSVSLLAVSKAQPIEAISAAIAAGQARFGENYLQEALLKIAHFSDQHLEWHYIGRIQSNKTRQIAENFAWVHSLESLRHAQRLNDQRPDNLPPLQCCMEINIADEDTKGGTDLAGALKLAELLTSLPKLELRGLMALPPIHHELLAQRSCFARVRDCYTALRQIHPAMDTLSMGMSADLEAAIAEGSTIVRVGTGIFGPRPKKPS